MSYQLIQSIRDLIDRYVVGRLDVTEPTGIDATTIRVQTTRNYAAGDDVAIYDDDNIDRNRVCAVVDGTTLTLTDPLQGSYNSGSIQKTYEGLFVRHVLIGNPPSIPTYPAITVELDRIDREPLTLESVQDTHELNIHVFVDTSNFDASFKLMHDLAGRIELSLFLELYPIIEPFNETRFAEDVAPEDTIIRVTDPDVLTCGIGPVIFESPGRRKMNRINENLGNGVFGLTFSAGGSFVAGDKVIQPLVHGFNPSVHSIEFGTTIDNDVILKAARISYSLNIEKRRNKSMIR